MDISQVIQELKKESGFKDNVGMVLVHNGVVRGRPRHGETTVTGLEVAPDEAVIEKLRRKHEQRPGIFRIVVQAEKGRFEPGDDLLFIVVAGDIRENVHPVLADLLNDIKSQAMHKTEFTAQEG